MDNSKNLLGNVRLTKIGILSPSEPKKIFVNLTKFVVCVALRWYGDKRMNRNHAKLYWPEPISSKNSKNLTHIPCVDNYIERAERVNIQVWKQIEWQFWVMFVVDLRIFISFWYKIMFKMFQCIIMNFNLGLEQCFYIASIYLFIQLRVRFFCSIFGPCGFESI